MRGLFFEDALQTPLTRRQVLENRGLLAAPWRQWLAAVVAEALLPEAWRTGHVMKRDAASKRMPRRVRCSTITSTISISWEDKG